MKNMLLIIAVICSTNVEAAPWNKDCVTFWGKPIPQDQRNSENCPTGRSHWDVQRHSGQKHYGQTIVGTVINAPITNPSLPLSVITGTGTQLIVPRYSEPQNSLPAAIIPITVNH